ncbi:MAG: hypothetical protein AAB413_02520 [Patescibacteria group bacterium]
MMGYYSSMMGFGSGFGSVTILLLWILVVLGIVALVKYIGKK